MQNDQLSPKHSQNNTKCYSSLPLKKCCTRALIKFHTNYPHVMLLNLVFLFFFFPQHCLGNFKK